MRTRLLVCLCLTPLLRPVELRLVSEAVVGAPVTWELVGTPVGDATAPGPSLLIRGEDDELRVRSFVHRPHARRPDGELRPTGDPVRRLRHCFAAAGDYRLRLLAAGGERVLAEDELRIAAAPGPHGPLRVSPHNPLLLAWADGTPYVPVGINLCWANGPDPLGTYLGYLERFAAAGGDHVRLWAASWFGQVESDRPNRYRLDQAWLLDRILAAARERGVTVTLVIDNHHDLGLGRKMPYGTTLAERLRTFFAVPLPKQYRRRLAYLTARYAAYDNLLAWELFNEMDLIAVPVDRALAWTAAAGRELRRLDPYRHLRTISLSDPNWADVFILEEIDLTQIHQYVPYLPKASEMHRDSMSPLLQHQVWAMRQGQPFCFAETGHHGTNADNPGNAADRRGLLLQQQAWGGLLCGGYGSGMNWWWDVYVDRNRLWHLYRPLADTVARIDWTDRELLPIRPRRSAGLRLVGWQSPDQALIHPVQDADTWYAHVVEGRPRSRNDLQSRAMIMRDLHPERSYRLVGIDMRSGEETRRERLRSDERGLLWVDINPDVPDEVMLLRAEASGPDPP